MRSATDFGPFRRLPRSSWPALLLAGLAGAAYAQPPEPAPGAEALPAPPAALPSVAEPPPMYIPDPSAADGFPGFRPFDASDRLPDWPRWFAGASGLVMTRTLPNGAATMQPVGGTQLTTTTGGLSWPGGVDLHLGRWFGARQHHGVEFIYWGVFGLDSQATTTVGGINAIPQAGGAQVDGMAANDLLTNAQSQQVSRADLVNDVEVNYLYSLWDRPEFLSRDPATPTRPVSLIWLAGFRFFQLEDVLTLSTSRLAGGDPLDFAVATNNNLYGGQMGAKFDWRFAPRLRFSTVPKFLLAGNAITNTSTLATASGTPATFTATGAPVNVHSTLGVFSWLGSVDTGVAWDVTDHWSLWVGYRVVGVGNIAQADGQWPSDITTASDLSGVTAGSSTIVHGGFAGFQGRY
jgi:hypothetical protein